MTKNILLRLRKLERRFPPPPPPPTESDRALATLKATIFHCVPFYLGDPHPQEATADAFARALGYESRREFRSALMAHDPDWDTRYAAAVGKLFAKCGISRDSELTVFVADIDRIAPGLSERYKKAVRELAAMWLALKSA